MLDSYILLYAGDDVTMARKSDIAALDLEFVLDLIKVDETGREHWHVVREAKRPDTGQ